MAGAQRRFADFAPVVTPSPVTGLVVGSAWWRLVVVGDLWSAVMVVVLVNVDGDCGGADRCWSGCWMLAAGRWLVIVGF